MMADSETNRVGEDEEQCGVKETRSVCGPCRGAPQKKLVLHIDLNNTVLVSDAATRQGTVAALDGFLATVTWGKMNKQGSGFVTLCRSFYMNTCGRPRVFGGGPKRCHVTWGDDMALNEWHSNPAYNKYVAGYVGCLTSTKQF